MSTPPRIRGLVDRLEHAVRMQMYAKREDKKQRKQEVLQAKMAILRAFALLSQPSAQQSDPWAPSDADCDHAIHRNPDAKAWADLFVSTFPGLADKHELMISWFANAMMAMHDHLKAQQSAPERDSLPDGYALVPVEPNQAMLDAAMMEHAQDAVYRAMVKAAPTVKDEQAPTPEFVWVRLLEALAGDNGCPFTASTDDYREAKPALVQLIAAGFFRDDADSLDGDIWMVASGEQGEAAARFARCAEAYTVLSNVLNRVFERDDRAYDRNAERLTAEALGTGSGINMAATSIDELFDAAPSLPAAGSAVEEVEVVGLNWPEYHYQGMGCGLEDRGITDRYEAMQYGWDCAIERCAEIVPDEPLMTVAQHERIVAALSAQQAAPERVSVPVELLGRAMYAKDGRELAEANRELRALLNGGEA